jgi:MYXO-CTERM domain-containing protein
VAGAIDMVAATVFSYDTQAGGPCTGDDGGATLTSITAGDRVAGVALYRDANCNMTGVSARVSAVYDDFIAPNLSAEGSGGGGAGGSMGNGGMDASGGGDPQGAGGAASGADEGEGEGCGCATVGSREAPTRWWPFAALLAGLAVRRRRDEVGESLVVGGS